MSEVWSTIHATKGDTTTPIPLYLGQNSFGEQDVFAGKMDDSLKEFIPLRGYPLYAIQQWLVDRGYTYKVD